MADAPEERPPGGYRFNFGGLNTVSAPDALPPNKFPSAVNIRSDSQNSVRTRPGYQIVTPTENSPIVNIRAYSGAASPALLARTQDGRIWSQVGGLLYPSGGSPADPGSGESLIPFRPAESPQSWMYCGSNGKYIKIGPPGSNPAYQNVGIAEPQFGLPGDGLAQCEAASLAPSFSYFLGPAGDWTASGTASAIASGPLSQTVGFTFADPQNSARFSVVVSASLFVYLYQDYEIDGQVNSYAQDVIAPIVPVNPTSGVTLQAVYAVPATSHTYTVVPSVMGPDQLPFLRRGAMIYIASHYYFVLSSTLGPDGSIAIDVYSTSGTVPVVGNQISGLSVIIVDSTKPGGTSYNIPTGATFGTGGLAATVTAGVGILSTSFATPGNPFSGQFADGTVTSATGAPQIDDYLHIALYASVPTNVNEIKIVLLLGSSGTDQLYYSFTPSDLTGVANDSQTQLQAIFSATTTAAIEAIDPSIAPGTLPPGTAWSEIVTPLSSFIRVGSNPNLGLADVSSLQIVANVANTITLQWSSAWVSGGFSPDTGDDGVPYKYRAVPVASATRVQGNPSPEMRYGVSPRRQNVKVVLPDPTYDSQIDTWDIYRYGGSVTSYRYLASVPAAQGFFIDPFFDDRPRGGNVMQTDNTQPWPTIDVPLVLNSISGIVAGTWIELPNTIPANVDRWLPGTLIILGNVPSSSGPNQTSFTLRQRPIPNVGDTGYVFQLEESAGAFTGNIDFIVREPVIAAQPLPYLWGPDSAGTVFGAGDPFRPSRTYFAKQNQPDACPSKYSLETCPPSEPIIGGVIFRGLSVAASTNRWWALYAAFNEPQHYSPVEQPVGMPLVSPWGICTDGSQIYFWSKDCIARSGLGAAESTTNDLYNLFPHDSVVGSDVTRNGQTYYAPNYALATQFRLSVGKGFLYADYPDSTGNWRTLVMDLRSGAWVQDVYAEPMSCHYASEQNTNLYLGSSIGNLHVGSNVALDNGATFGCQIATFEEPGDLRSAEYWEDGFLDARPVASIAIFPQSRGASIAGVAPTVIAAAGNSAPRTPTPISLAGGQLLDSLGFLFTWIEATSAVWPVVTSLYIFQATLVEQPVITTDAAEDWTDCGTPGAKFVQGLLLEADTYGEDKVILAQTSEALTLYPLQPAPVNHARRIIRAYSFNPPFVAHLVKLVPGDQVPWRKFSEKWIFQPTPEMAETWQTQYTGHGLKGYHHIGRIQAAYAATNEVTVTILVFDGSFIGSLTLPPTGGAYQKMLLTPPYNKGQLYQYILSSPTPFQLYLQDWIIWVKEWGSEGPYAPYQNLGGDFGDKATI